MDDEEMKIESNRLSTFVHWPLWLPVEPSRIAAAGFYATGMALEVKCPWCKSKISKWGFGEVSVMARHCLLDPLCPFVVNPTTYGNTTISDSDDLMNEQCRFQTFVNWRNTYVSPMALATAGFYYYNQSDHVRCVWCHGVMGQWEEGDEPLAEHDKFFPNCPRIAFGSNITYLAGDSIKDLGIQVKRIPSREKYSSLDLRTKTFSNWPQRDIQSPEALATAGFYYSNIDDQVKCFHCNGCLRSWQKEDDPWYEHAKWFPTCQFLQLAKGSEYIQGVQDQTKGNLDEARKSQEVQESSQMGLPEERISTENSQQNSSKNYKETTENVPESSNQNTYRTTKKRDLALEEENRKLKEARVCKICMVDEVDVVFMPCGHLVICFQCVSSASAISTCLSCQQRVKAYVRVFLS